MHEAYKATQLLQHNVQFESIAAYDSTLLLGTRQGHLLMYNVIQQPDGKVGLEQMVYNKTFSKKPVQQIEVIPYYHLVVILTDGVVQVHDINGNFPLIHQASKTRGATLFTLDIKETTSLTGEKTTFVRMAVAVKRKLQLYYWKKTEFMELCEDINLNDIPKALSWCQETICVGYKGEYSLYTLSGSPTDLFPTSGSKSSDPCIVKMSDNTFGLGRETQTVIVNVTGSPEKSKALKWTEVPSSVVWDEPYALGILNNCIEIQTMEPVSNLIQTINDLPKVRLLAYCKPGLVYAASVSHIWRIQAVHVSLQRRVLLENKQFHLALKLTEVSDESEEEKKTTIHRIQTLLAYDLFNQKRFNESMKEFIKLDTDPYDVIRLFPDLLPTTGHEEEDYKSDLTERELEEGLQALIEYLTEIRHKKQGNVSSTNASGNLNLSESNKSNSKLLQIIDTTLLKCYLQTNEALVAPLLRLNHCHLAETERTLKKYGKHNELIILYQTKGQHRRALELLQSDKAIERTISNLQHLGAEQMGLILEFADWVLKESPEEGLKIFTEDLSEVESLPRPRVLDYLLRSHPDLVIPYLEHVVHVWKDTNPLFHNALVHQYREKAITQDPSAVHARKKLLEFLEKSCHYTPDTVLVNFPCDNLLEERAVIVGRLGRHEQALGIYVRVLGDVERALKYCEKVYEQGSINGQEVYVSLIKLILNPNSLQISLPGVVLSPKTSCPDLEQALNILEKHADRVNPLTALAVLPDNVQVSRINKFLQMALHSQLQERRRVQLLRGLLYAEHLQCQEMRLQLQSQSILITDLNVCTVCKKRFGNQSALVRHPNGEVVHYSCSDKKL